MTGLPLRVAIVRGPQRRQPVLVPVGEVNLATLKMLRYAGSISDNVIAVHVTDDMDAGQRFRTLWESTVVDVPLVVIDSPYRSFVAPFLSYIEALVARENVPFLTVVVPDLRTAFPWERWLHNQSARRLRSALRDRTDVVSVEVPYQLTD